MIFYIKWWTHHFDQFFSQKIVKREQKLFFNSTCIPVTWNTFYMLCVRIKDITFLLALNYLLRWLHIAEKQVETWGQFYTFPFTANPFIFHESFTVFVCCIRSNLPTSLLNCIQMLEWTSFLLWTRRIPYKYYHNSKWRDDTA